MSDTQTAREPRREDFVANNRNPFASDVPATRPVGAIANAEQQRSIAEVQARMIIARSNPRDPIRCMDLILRDCTRATLAKGALYQYARGGSSISGPSIRLAEAIAQRWGNIASGIKEVSRSGGYSECVAYAWDLESGYYDERQFQVRHWRDTQKGGYAITEERDIYELIANMGQRRKRAVMLTVIPGDVVEAAVEQCEQTLKLSFEATPEYLTQMLASFAAFGVTKAQIEKRCQCHLEAIRPAQIVQLNKIYTSLNDGMSAATDWFETLSGTWAGVEAGHAATTEQQRPATRKAPTKKAAAEAVTKPAEPKEDQVPFDRWEDESTAQTTAPVKVDQPTSNASVQTDGDAHKAPAAASLASFRQYLVDGEGDPIPDGDGVIEEFTDPVAFAHAFKEAEANEFPGTVELFRRANHDALALAMIASTEVSGILAPKQPAPVQQAPQTARSDNPTLPMDMPVDPWVVAAPASKAKAEMTRYLDELKAVAAKVRTPKEYNHVRDVNAPIYDTFLDARRLQAMGIMDSRLKEMAPAPARDAAGPTMKDLADSLLHDIYSLTAPESVPTWLAMDTTKAALAKLDPEWHAKVTKGAEARQHELIAEATAKRTPRQILDAVNARMRACVTSDEAITLIYRPDHVADTKVLAEYPELIAEMKNVAVEVSNLRPEVWAPVKEIYAAAKRKREAQ